MFTVGLTGGIASGKSYILVRLGELGSATLDADVVAHQVIEPGRPAYAGIVESFGPEVVSADGRIDRAKLGAIVFRDKAQREKLNSIVHPRVFEAQTLWLERTAALDPRAIAVVDAALMIETGAYRRFDRVIVAFCKPELQIERLIARNHLSLEDARARIAAQMPTEEKLKYADFVVDTSLGFEDTRRQVDLVYGELGRLAKLKEEKS